MVSARLGRRGAPQTHLRHERLESDCLAVGWRGKSRGTEGRARAGERDLVRSESGSVLVVCMKSRDMIGQGIVRVMNVCCHSWEPSELLATGSSKVGLLSNVDGGKRLFARTASICMYVTDSLSHWEQSCRGGPTASFSQKAPSSPTSRPTFQSPAKPITRQMLQYMYRQYRE